MAQWTRDIRALMETATTPEAWFAALATTRADVAGAANRMVVVRGFLEVDGTQDGVGLVAGEGICVVAHRESGKVAEARLGAWAELCWYWQSVREQFRIAGSLAVLDAQRPGTGALAEVRRDLWRSLSAATRKMFAWPPPGMPRSAPGDAEHRAEHAGEVAVSAQAPPPDTFAVLVLAPQRVDWLRLCEPGPHQRALETRRASDGTWERREVSP